MKIFPPVTLSIYILYPLFFSDLEAHQVIHSGVRPFKCEECSATFARKRTLFQHYRVIHKIKKGRDYLKQGGSENDDSKDDVGFHRDEDSNKSG